MWHDGPVRSLALIFSLLASASAPADAPAPADGAAEADPTQDGYGLEQARADVEVILVDRGKAYLEARARLEEHPALAAEAVMGRLDAVPAPGPEKRDRLLNVLASLHRPEHVALFGDQLRGAMLGDRPTELWIQLLRKQGPAAAPVLIGLVGDRELSNEQRGQMLELLVELTAREGLGDLMAMVGRGSSELQDTLRRALIRRARADVDDEAAIAAGIDAGMASDAEEPGRLAQLVILRAACCSTSDAFTTTLESLAGDDATPFVVRVAAIDALDRLELGGDVLESLARARASAALAGEQAGEILVSLAIDGLAEDRAAALATELALTRAEAPRLARLGYEHATLATDHAWLEASQTHAWPEVRKAALERVAEAGSCDKGTLGALGKIAGPISGGGERDARVGRAAVGAIGRCASAPAFKLLRELLENTGVDLTQRGAAARQLAQRDPSGADHVAELLVDGRYPDLARDLVLALGSAAAPSELVREALCRTVRGNPMVASTAQESLSKLFPAQGCPDRE